MGHYFTNENLESNIKKFDVSFNNYNFTFSTDNGVFSKGELDYGTYLLIKNVIKKDLFGNILDLGCGYGSIGIIISKLFDLSVTMVDVNKRAIHLTKMNAKDNKVLVNPIVSDGYNEIGDEKYNFIISNPPIRVGKKILYDLLINAKNHLEKDGEIIIVVRKEQGANSLIKDMGVYYDVNIVDKDKGFLIISLK